MRILKTFDLPCRQYYFRWFSLTVLLSHRHLSNIDCLTVCIACLVSLLVLLIAAAKKKPRKTGASSRHITNLKQSTLETFNIYVLSSQLQSVVECCSFFHQYQKLDIFWLLKESDFPALVSSAHFSIASGGLYNIIEP